MTTLIDRLLDEQQALTPVERFARRHDDGHLPAHAKYYRDLIPASKPGAGQQYAFAVDLDACSACKACVSACHSLNGLGEHETWRDVGVLIGGTVARPYLQTVTTACHHCLDPACLEGCPVLAYHKDPATGIVRHLDDQCIGCQYCTMKCPYDVPKYSPRLGIVRKCDLCGDRLAANEAPACVQACPHGAIAIRLVDVAEVSGFAAKGRQLVPGAFDSSYTRPTTRYFSSREIPGDAAAADAHALRLEHAHWPLIVMLTLTQMAAGLFVAGAGTTALGRDIFRVAGAPLASAAFVVLGAGLAASVFHLGRPLGAWRFFLGLRTSWMSREILAFGVFGGAAAAATALCWFAPGSGIAFGVLAVAALAGLGGVFTSVMIYADTRRALWAAPLAAGRFFGTTFLLGAAAAAVVLGWTDRLDPAEMSGAAVAMTVAATAIRTALFGWEFGSFLRALSVPSDPNHRSARTMRERLPWLVPVRCLLFSASTLASLLAIANAGGGAVGWASLAFATTLGSQVLERYGFFTTVVAPRMPGGI